MPRPAFSETSDQNKCSPSKCDSHFGSSQYPRLDFCCWVYPLVVPISLLSRGQGSPHGWMERRQERRAVTPETGILASARLLVQ
eukprot:4894714-Amphidinium_carterae.1